MVLRSPKSRLRSERGSIIGIGIGLLIILIPVGILVYDLTLIRQQYNQLKAATDAAALAAALWARLNRQVPT